MYIIIVKEMVNKVNYIYYKTGTTKRYKTNLVIVIVN